MPRPVCFMIMPYGTKPTAAQGGQGPAEIDFNALWDRAYVPVITGLGYEPVRADQETGALIIGEMLERLFLSDLVLADMTLPNGNVYYEVGIRHAARENGCVLLAADWSRQLFDVAQMRTVRYPLPEGSVSADTAAAIQAAIRPGIEKLARGTSPMHQALPGYPDKVDTSRASSIRRQLDELSAFQSKVRAVRAMLPAMRLAPTRALIEAYLRPPVLPNVALGLFRLLRDAEAPWSELLTFIDALPEEVRDLPELREQRCLAMSKGGDPHAAIGALEELIRLRGATPEREGLIGGRYKQLYRKAADERERRHYLDRAIEHYERGMQLDLNDYYPSSNLPRLYRARGAEGDAERARSTLCVLIAACRRRLELGGGDEWLRPTLIGAAFDAADLNEARRICSDIEREGPAQWKLDTLLGDLEHSIQHLDDGALRGEFEPILARLRAL